MALLRCPRCGLAVVAAPEGRVQCLACSRLFKIVLEEDRVGPFSAEEQARALVEFLEDVYSKGEGKDG